MKTRREYNPINDTWVEVDVGTGKMTRVEEKSEFTPRQATSAEDRDLRIQCLELAISAAKSGSSFGEPIPKIAQAYYLFSLGEVPPADPFAGLSFEQRLDVLVQEFLRSETEDPAKIKHSIETVYERFLVQFPPPVMSEDPSNIGDDGRDFTITTNGKYPERKQVVRPSVQDLTETIRM